MPLPGAYREPAGYQMDTRLAPAQGYSQEPASRSRLLEREVEQPAPPAYERRWDSGDDASRYEPPGSEEVDKDPFGLNRLPKQTAYQGPCETPRDAYVGAVIGLMALALFPLVLIGLPRARRAISMIESSPARYQGLAMAKLGLGLNFVAPITSLLLASYFLIP